MASINIPPAFPARLQIPADLAIALVEQATKSIAVAAKEFRRYRRPRRGETLKPGVETPLWNELVMALRPAFRRYGDQAKLARILRLPRQRVHELLRRPRYLPDAERTLLLLVWLHARQHGSDLG